MSENKRMTKEQIIEHWGEEFAELADNPRLHFLDDAILIDLTKPVVTDEGETKQLRFREPLGEDMMASDEGGEGQMARTIHLIKSCTGLPLISIKKMRAKDIMLANQVATAFL